MLHYIVCLLRCWVCLPEGIGQVGDRYYEGRQYQPQHVFKSRYVPAASAEIVNIRFCGKCQAESATRVGPVCARIRD